MAVLARPVLLVVGVVVPLGVAFGIEHVALRVVIEDVEGALLPKRQPDHVVAGFGQDAPPLQHLAPGLEHCRQGLPRQVVEFGSLRPGEMPFPAA